MKALFIGLGGIGQRHARNLRALLQDRVEIHAYRVRRRTQTLTDKLEVEPAANLEEKYNVHVHSDLDEALAIGPLAVFICNPSSLHVPCALQAARAGCHLFVEKPLSHNLDQVDELIDLVHTKSLVGLVAYQLRFHPCIKRLRAIVTEGLLGQVLAARVEVGEHLPDWHRYEDYRQMYAARADQGGGVILSQIHEFDYLYWLFGLPQRLFTVGGHFSGLEIDVEDVASSVLEFNVGGRPVAVQVHQDYVQRPAARGCMVLGDAGKVIVNLREPALVRYDKMGEMVEEQSFAGLERNQLFLDEMSHFLACIRGEATPVVSLADGAQSLRMAVAARQSLAVRRVVELS
jgi:predicted dehydrogenase